MAKRKKAKILQRSFKEDDTVIENGVAVSRHGRDRGSEHLLKNGRDIQEDIVVEEIQVAARQNKTRNSKRVDCLDRLYKKQEIDARRYEAGRSFQIDYFNGNLMGYPETRFFFVPATTGDNVPHNGMVIARRRVSEVMALLNQKSKDMAKVAEELIGKDRSLRDMAGTNANKRGYYEAFLILALAIIADYYSPPTKKRY